LPEIHHHHHHHHHHREGGGIAVVLVLWAGMLLTALAGLVLYLDPWNYP
jgi:hypothetical protein